MGVRDERTEDLFLIDMTQAGNPAEEGQVRQVSGDIVAFVGGSVKSFTSGITAEAHAALRQLVHLADGIGGPMEQWATGAYRETLPAGDPFPTSIIWYTSISKTHRIMAKLISYNANKTPATVQWSAYALDGSTVIAQVTDTITHSSVFEVSRTRTHT